MSESAPQPGATYKFTVHSADEAVRTIRERLGENAKVLSVRQVGSSGLGGLFTKPKLEVVAQVADAVPAPPAGLATLTESDSTPPLFRSDEPAAPMTLLGPAPMLAPAAPSPRVGRPVTSDGPTRLPELLRRSGFSEATLSRLQTTPDFAAQEQLPLHQSLVEVGRSLRRSLEARKPRPLPARTAFLGTPGVGRTTALCKWLAREIFARGRTGRVVKAEFDKPNPAEGLAVFCEALGLTLEYYAPPAAEENPSPGAAPAAEPCLSAAPGFLYADLPGLSLRSPADNAALSRFLERENFAGRVLVLNAAYDPAMLRRAYAAGRDLGATHLVFTHLDELEHWGKLWDFLLDGELTPLFLATGPSLTGDCEEDAVSALLRRTLPGS
jgi:flagellar biosynthesis protein FlhF